MCKCREKNNDRDGSKTKTKKGQDEEAPNYLKASNANQQTVIQKEINGKA